MTVAVDVAADFLSRCFDGLPLGSQGGALPGLPNQNSINARDPRSA
jgi:hypothetical protein